MKSLLCYTENIKYKIMKGGKIQMKAEKLLTGIVTVALGLSIMGFSTANADIESSDEIQTYTIDDIRNLQDFLLARDTPDLSEKTMI